VQVCVFLFLFTDLGIGGCCGFDGALGGMQEWGCKELGKWEYHASSRISVNYWRLAADGVGVGGSQKDGILGCIPHVLHASCNERQEGIYCESSRVFCEKSHKESMYASENRTYGVLRPFKQRCKQCNPVPYPHTTTYLVRPALFPPILPPVHTVGPPSGLTERRQTFASPCSPPARQSLRHHPRRHDASPTTDMCSILARKSSLSVSFAAALWERDSGTVTCVVRRYNLGYWCRKRSASFAPNAHSVQCVVGFRVPLRKEGNACCASRNAVRCEQVVSCFAAVHTYIVHM
jgi:hypothetical protein